MISPFHLKSSRLRYYQLHPISRNRHTMPCLIWMKSHDFVQCWVFTQLSNHEANQSAIQCKSSMFGYIFSCQGICIRSSSNNESLHRYIMGLDISNTSYIVFCRLCREPNHVPLKCEEVEKQNETDMRTFIEKRVTEAMLRKCHRCGKRFVKDVGCNKMTCICGATSCYICREPDIHYSHFNGSR